jgi:hypothetical protein
MRPVVTALLVSIGCVLAFALPACDCKCNDAGGASARADPRGEADAKYTVRGRIEMLPIAGQPQTELVVHHEAIPSFKGFDGKTGMESMSMPFPVAKGLDLSAVAIGDAVELDFVVWMKPGHKGFEARRVAKLPAGTRLAFEGAK